VPRIDVPPVRYSDQDRFADQGRYVDEDRYGQERFKQERYSQERFESFPEERDRDERPRTASDDGYREGRDWDSDRLSAQAAPRRSARPAPFEGDPWAED
jgi:hypothetical protein